MKLKEIIQSILITTFLLILFELFTTSLIPAFGIHEFKLPFNIAIILYLGLCLSDFSYLAIIILYFQLVHSAFSIGGFETGTVAGILVSMLISQLKDLIHLTSYVVTIFVFQILQIVWFIIEAILILLRTGDWEYVINKCWHFIPESIILSLISPFIFVVLNRIWLKDNERIGVNQ